MKDYYGTELENGMIIAFNEHKQDKRYKNNMKPLWLSYGVYRGDGIVSCLNEYGSCVDLNGMSKWHFVAIVKGVKE